MNEDPSVRLAGVHKRYATQEKGQIEVRAVEGLDLEIRHGEFFTLLGPSGCGKTTTLRLIAGFETPDLGDVFLLGRRMNDVQPYHRPVNTVFQNYALFPHLTVEKNVAFGLTVRRVPTEERARRVAAALGMVQMEAYAGRYPAQLSGGQQQRVALARALVNEPAVLLLDEPLGALDLKLRKEMQYELKRLQAEVGITFVYVTHDQEEALTMSDRIAVMNMGHVLQIGTPAEIYERPADRFVAGFIGDTNLLTAQVTGVQNGLLNLALAGGEVALPRNGHDLAVGQSVTLAVRPERLKLMKPEGGGEGDDICLRGRVREVIFAGADTRYLVGLGSGESLAVLVRSRDAAGALHFDEGEDVMVVCEPVGPQVLAG